MKKVNLNKIMQNGKAMYLAYDQGLEHGPASDFNDKNVDPLYILDVAKKGKFNAIVYQKGIVEKYLSEIKKSKVPLILKLNGKTKLAGGEPISAQIASVDDARKLGASAVGFTIYIGSSYESQILEEFSKIEREAHKYGLPVVTWIYPRGKAVAGKPAGELLQYAARVALEIGADIVKVHWNGNEDDLKKAVKAAGRTKVVVAGGLKAEGPVFLQMVKNIMKTGASGLAVGRNIWQSDNPLELSKSVRKIINDNN
ncbi:fructose-bisphosphate aldolase [Candidatus Pacearchaeota archaeon CG10_big_fil_rev_8_21_14_0_10_31_24]|nr:MAG: fructose-bisphosphate aldolase [Candidatus Pacearchaeota archaeon CG10_big_fil_rev_8_21_14_0_10_31_24]